MVNVGVKWKTSITQLASIFNNWNVMDEWYDRTGRLSHLFEQGKLLHPAKQVTGCTCITRHEVNKISAASESKYQWTFFHSRWENVLFYSDSLSHDRKTQLEVTGGLNFLWIYRYTTQLAKCNAYVNLHNVAIKTSPSFIYC